MSDWPNPECVARHNETHGVIERLSLHEIWEELRSVTEHRFTSSSAAFGPTQRVRYQERYPGDSPPTELEGEVFAPPTDSGASAWIGEIRALGGPGRCPERLYRFGQWIVRIDEGPSYYAHTIGHLDLERRRPWGRLGDSYFDLWRHAVSGRGSLSGIFRTWLTGKPVPWSVEPSTANIGVAMLVSEAARNYRTWLVNLMILDLLEVGFISSRDLLRKLHPMCQGGTFQPGQTGFRGGQVLPSTRLLEAQIAATWLCARTMYHPCPGNEEFLPLGQSERQELVPPNHGRSAFRQARFLVRDLLLKRASTLEWLPVVGRERMEQKWLSPQGESQSEVV